MNIKKIFFFLVLQFFFFLRSDGQDLLDYPNSLNYADYLFNSGQYQLSAIEYERVVFLAPYDTVAKLNLIKSYRYSDNYKNAKERIDFFFPGNKINIQKEFAIEYVKLMLHEQNYGNAFDFLQNNKTLELSMKSEYQLGILLMQYKWEEARAFGDEYYINNQRTDDFDKMYNIALKGHDIQYKNPYVAAGFSAIIPGSGKIYTKYWKDAIYAFLFIGTTSWLTYNSINNNGLNLNNVILGSVTISFYTANIFGSFKSAKRYNQKINRLHTKEIAGILDLD